MKKAAKSTVTLLFAFILMASMFVPAFAASVGTVKSLKASKVTYNSVTLSWNAVSKVSGYSVEQYNTSKKKWAQVATTNDKTTSKTISSLKTGTSYKFRVRAYSKNVFGKVTYGSYSSTLTAKPMPAKITTLKASTTTSSVKLTWSTVSKATGYKVQVLSGNKWKDYKTIKGASTKSITISKLKINTTYSYRVAAYNTVSKKTYIGAYTTVTAKTELKKPTLKASSITTTGAKLSWGAVSEASGYKIESYVNKKWTTLDTIKNGKTTSYTFTKGVPATTYQVRISAYKTVSKKNYFGAVSSTVKFKTASVATPKNLAASGITLTGAKITWSKVADATGYKLETYVNKKWSPLSTIKSNNTTSYSFTKAVPNTSYKFRIKAYKTASGKDYDSAVSSTLTFKTNAVAVPSDFKASNTSYTSTTLSWSKVADATGYRISTYTDGAWKTLKTIKGADTLTYKMSVSPNTSYRLYIKAYKTIGETNYFSAQSSEVQFNTNIPTVSGLRFSDVTYTSAKLSWNGISGATGYEVTCGGKTTTVNTTTYNVTGLEPGKSYSASVKALVGSSKGAAATTTANTPSIPTVTGFAVTGNTTSSVSLKWNAVAGASYVITGGPSEVKATGTTATITGLKSGTAYTFKITAVVSGYSSAAQSVSTKTVVGKVETVDADETAKYSAESSTYMATIRWNAVSGAEGYVIHSDDKSLTDVTTTKTTGYVHYLRTSKIYSFTVKAYSTIDGKRVYGEQSASVTVKTPVSAVSRSSIVVSNEVAPKATDAAVITWREIPGATYIVEKYIQPGNGVSGGYVLAENDLKQAKFVVEGTPSFEVKAEKSGDYLTKISWERPAGGDYTYDVEAANVKTGVWFNIGSTKDTSVTVRLAAGTKYIFRVIADYGNTQIRITSKNALGDKSGTTEKMTELQYPIRYGVSAEYTTGKNALANNNESKTQYALMAIEALNAATHDKSKVNVKLVSDIDSDVDDTTLKIGLITLSLNQFFEKYKDELAKEGISIEDITKELANLGESDNKAGTFVDGKGEVTYKEERYVFDENGKRVTQTVDGKTTPVKQEVEVAQPLNLYDLVEPKDADLAGFASLYNYNDVASFANKITSVTSTQNGDKTTIKMKLKKETTNGLQDNPAPVHSGFFTNVASVFNLKDMDMEGQVTADIAVGDNISFKNKNYECTELTFVLDKNGDLESYTIISPYSIKIRMELHDGLTSLSDVAINLVLKGVCNYNYTFTK